ncbi:MAG: monovalent cation:proton antiporter-2 (CPA2) family protein, partial [Sphingomonadales bacterium]
MTFFEQAAIFLAAAVLAVPIARFLGLGSVLGYLIAGVILGPFGFGTFYNAGELLHFAEFGVVLLLFVIGLELNPKRLWTLRRAVFGIGSAQVLLTGAALTGAVYFIGQPLMVAAVIGFSLALSSTALGLQTLAERQEIATPYGRTGFGVLLFQDLAAIPLLVIIPLLVSTDAGGFSFVAVAKGLGAIAVVIIGGRYLLQFFLRLVAKAGLQEVMTAAALLVVAATALLMEFVGLSMALGAFLAGVLLADSEFRHEMEANIEPFKGLLLGLFFIAVGMSINLGLMASAPLSVLGLVVGLVAIKFVWLVAAGKLAGLKNDGALRLGALLSEGGEFAFVIAALAAGIGLFGAETASMVVLVVALSMAVTPVLILVLDRFYGHMAGRKHEPDYETPEVGDVIIAGYGRFGQIASRIMRAKGISFTALEKNQSQIDFVKKFGAKVHYGDASRLDLLKAAGTKKAAAFILAIDDVDASLKTAAVVRKHFPDVPIFARARNRKHAYQLRDLGVHNIVRETLHSSLKLTE